MNLLRASYLRKASAILFLVLFAFVHAIKALHTHELSFASSYHYDHHNETDVRASFFCNICDFQIAKDSDAAITSFEIAAPEYHIHFYDHFTFSNYSSVVAVASGTDPPFSA